jgi:hypothetical protein
LAQNKKNKLLRQKLNDNKSVPALNQALRYGLSSPLDGDCFIPGTQWIERAGRAQDLSGPAPTKALQVSKIHAEVLHLRNTVLKRQNAKLHITLKFNTLHQRHRFVEEQVSELSTNEMRNVRSHVMD